METRPDVQDRWFKTHGQHYELDADIRKMVEFAPLNLVSGDYPSFETRTMNLDLIICRNVTIYFEEQTTRRIIERFQGALNEGGWLVVGHAEPMASVYQGFTPRNFPNAVVYQKHTMATRHPVQQAAMPVELPTTLAPPIMTRKPRKPQIDAINEARAAAGREDWSAVQQWLVDAERSTPMTAEVHYLRGLMLIHTQSFDGAMQALRRAIYCDSSFVLAHYALGDLHEKHGNHPEARRCWLRSQQIIAQRPPHEDLAPGENLTVEIFRDLLNYRLNNLPEGG
jgi:chemotaxis protein methyltransferase CheR